MRVALLLLSCLLPSIAVASETRVLQAIVFEGNQRTRDVTLLRELPVRPGEAIDDRLVEASRQAILDLGLFREVEVFVEPAGEGVRLRVRVREKYYLLPIPRLDTSSDRDLSYGGQLRWNNVAGLNHTLNLYAEQGKFPRDRLRERERSARITYLAPFVLDSPYRLAASAERIERQRPESEGGYDEDLERLQLLLLRDFTQGKPRRGWTLGGGLFHQGQDTAGAFAPDPDGEALALVGSAEYRDLRFHLYSETGRRFRSRLEWSEAAWSDYGYRQLTADYGEFIALGDRPHQSLHLLAEGGWRSGGPGSRSAFFLGGSGRMRGYRSQTFEGERYYRASVEYLRPLRWDSVRLLVLGEIGGTGNRLDRAAPRGTHANLGVGLRLRITWFVDTEIELGYAWPLRGGGSGRFFAGGN